MARRSDRPRRRTPLSALGDAFLRVAGAVVLDAFAFIVWNVGTRPPLVLLHDVRAGLRDRRSIAIGIASGIVGLVFIIASTVLLLPAIADRARDSTIVESLALLVALGVELLVGEDVRRAIGIARTRSL